jgi:hypothetical protein
MKRFWMRSLTGQLIGLMLLALVLSQVIFFLLYRSERESTLRTVQRDEFLARIASVTRLIATTDSALHPEILRAASTTLSRYWLSAEAPASPWHGRAERAITCCARCQRAHLRTGRSGRRASGKILSRTRVSRRRI